MCRCRQSLALLHWRSLEIMTAHQCIERAISRITASDLDGPAGEELRTAHPTRVMGFSRGATAPRFIAAITEAETSWILHRQVALESGGKSVGVYRCLTCVDVHRKDAPIVRLCMRYI